MTPSDEDIGLRRQSDRSGIPAASPGISMFFRLFLLAGLLIIAFVFIYYTQYVINKLEEDQTRYVNLYVRLWHLITQEPTSSAAVSFVFDEIIQKSTIPIIITDSAGNVQFWRGLEKIPEKDASPTTLDLVHRAMVRFDKVNPPLPIQYEGRIIYLFHYGEPKLVRQLQRMPLIMFALFGLFLIVAFIGFRNIKRAEQRFIWVGMAKETAHQLGTPLTSLLGWLEILRASPPATTSRSQNAGPIDLPEIAARMEWDLTRLQKVANRFGQIGSLPEMKSSDVKALIREAVEYFRYRLPGSGQGAIIREQIGELPGVELNPELFLWVIENLLKNSVESVDPVSGVIEISGGLSKDKRTVCISVTDNGKGIPSKQQRKIFLAGFTTKKRGWGLGLTLAKRIIEEYHRGKLILKESVPNQKTVFQILLPITQRG